MARNKTTEKLNLSNINNYYLDGLIRIPEYQRDKVWTKYQKQLLIDSILRDIDIPKIYFDVQIDENETEIYKVVDGQQRIGAIVAFFNDEFKTMSDSDPISGQDISNLLRSDLPNTIERQKFQNANLDVVFLREYSEEDVKEMFIRLQEGAPLNAPEKRRALPGNIPNIIENLSNHNMFSEENFLNFTNNRFAFQDRCAKIFHQFVNENILIITPNEIKKTYLANQDMEENNAVINKIKKSMNFVHRSLKDKSPKLAKYAVLRLVYLVNEMLKEYNLSNFPEEFGNAWIAFELDRREDGRKPIEEQTPELVEFGNCARGDSLAGQEYIHKHLKREFVKRIPKLELKDPTRSFSSTQRWIIFQKSNKKCQADTSASWFSLNHCEKNITLDNFHADHIIPHSGNPPGSTSVDNGQALCVSCNLRKSSS